MSSLSDLLEEPEDGATIVLNFGEIHEVARRDDDTAQDHLCEERERWFRISSAIQTPVTWESITLGATSAHALGPLLADLEAEK